MADRSVELKKAIDVLEDELESQLQEANETKKAINMLSVRMGEQPRYAEIGEENQSRSVSNIRSDQFFNKPLSSAVREFLEIKGSAATAKEIEEALNKGGYDFGSKHSTKNLKISLTKNRKLFAYIKTTDSFGLWDWYPEGKRKREAQQQDVKLEEETEEEFEEEEEDEEEES